MGAASRPTRYECPGSAPGRLGEGYADRDGRLARGCPGAGKDHRHGELEAELLAATAGGNMPVGVGGLPFGLGLHLPDTDGAHPKTRLTWRSVRAGGEITWASSRDVR